MLTVDLRSRNAGDMFSGRRFARDGIAKRLAGPSLPISLPFPMLIRAPPLMLATETENAEIPARGTMLGKLVRYGTSQFRLILI